MPANGFRPSIQSNGPPADRHSRSPWPTGSGCAKLVDEHLDLGATACRAHAGDRLLTLVLSALAGAYFIDDANALRAGGTERILGFRVKAATLGTFLRSFGWATLRVLA